jgi:transposase
MTNFLYLPGWEVTDVQDRASEYRATAAYTPEPAACPKCGTLGELYRHGVKVTDYRDAPVHGKQVLIEVRRRRYRCRACGGTFLQGLPDMDDTHRMTARCAEYVRQQSLLKPFTHVANDLGINEKTVRLIAREHIAAMNAAHRPYAPRVLGIDELTLLGKRRGIFVDIEGKRPLDLLEDHSRPVVTQWLHRLPHRHRVQVVSIDMWRPYRDAAADVLPQAVVVIDKFHVIRMANDAMETVRKSLQRSMQDKSRRESKRNRYLLLRRPPKLRPDQAFALDGWLKNAPDLADAYEAKENFFGIYDATTREDAEAAYAMWLETLTPGLKVAFKPLITSMTNWRKEIFAYFDHRVTNAYTEAVNGIVKIANRTGRGYSFDVIRARLLFGTRKPVDLLSQCPVCSRLHDPGDHIMPEGMLFILDGMDEDPPAPNLMVICSECNRFHTDRWFRSDYVSTPKSE